MSTITSRGLRWGTCAILGLAALAGSQTWFPLKNDPKQKIPFANEPKVYAFPFDRIRIGDGPVHPYLTSDSAWLRSLDADKMMAPYVKQAGLPEVAPPYGALGASTTGHFLSALALAYAGTGEKAFKDKADRMVSEFARVQKRIGTGDIGLGDGPTAFWDDVVKGGSYLRPGDMSLNGVNVPWYVYHKAFGGLIDAYLWTDNQLALEVLKGLGDWIIAKFSPMPESEFQRMLQAEYGGIEECLEDLYLLTGQVKYRDMGRRFTRKWSMGDLFLGKDNLTHKHGNTHLPQYMSAARRAETTTDASNWTAALTAWNSIVDGRSFSMGGTTNWESWQVDPGQFPLISPNDKDTTQNKRRGGPETCISYNMLKMGVHMQAIDRRTRIGDHMERMLWNHILTAWNPDNHGTIYFTPVHHGLSKAFVTSESWWPCCRNSALESQTRHAAFTWMWDGAGLLVEQFVASTLDWKEKGYKVSLTTRFPEEDTLRIKFATAAPAKFAFKVRKPHWLNATAVASVNGVATPITTDSDGRFVFDRTWADGDELKLVLPQTLRLEVKPDEHGRVSIFKGPILLAALMGPSDEDPKFQGSRKNLEQWIHPVAGTPDYWARTTDGKTMTLRPFFRVREERYSIYPGQFDAPAGDEGVYEAELGTVTDAKVYGSADASAGSYVGGIDNATSRVVFAIRSLGAVECTLVVRYANGTGGVSKHAIATDAEWTGSVFYPATAGWGKFDSAKVAVSLVAGLNMVAFSKSDGYAELDRVRVVAPAGGVPLPWIWEAEEAALQDVRIDHSATKASGAAAVGGIDHATSRIDFLDFRVPSKGAWKLRARYSNGTTGNSSLKLSVGNRTSSITLPPTSGWGAYGAVEVALDLDGGIQNLSVGKGDGYAQLDALELVAPTAGAATPRPVWIGARLRKDGWFVASREYVGGILEVVSLDGRRLGAARLEASGQAAVARCPLPGSGQVVLWRLVRAGRILAQGTGLLDGLGR